jgi:CheY-like chemotaxis protein
MMGGNIWVESKSGEGSCFNFTIKFEIDKIEAPGIGDANDKPVEIYNNTDCNILYVEDDKVNQRVVDYFLKGRGCNLSYAGNGREAIEMYEKNHYDIILMDIQLPEMNGLEATVEIRKREELTGKHTPIIALTAYALNGDRERFLSLGIDEYLSKPVNEKELIETINKFKSAETNKVKSSEDEVKNILDSLNSKINNSIDENLYLKYRKCLSGQVAALNSAIVNKNMKIIESIAHRIKELALETGADTLKEYAFKIERAARRDGMKDIEGLFKDLKDVSDSIK